MRKLNTESLLKEHNLKRTKDTGKTHTHTHKTSGLENLT